MADRKRVKARYWEAVIPALRSLEFLGDLPQGRTVGLLGLPLTRRAFRYGLRPRFGKKRLSLLLFVRGPDRAKNFDALHAERSAIEEVIGQRLVWRPDVPWSKATSLIELVGDGLDPNDVTTLDRQKAWFVNALRRFHAAFHERCLKLAPRDAPRPMTVTRQKRRKWWTLVLGEIARQSDLFAGRQPPAETWIGAGSGVRGVPFVLSVTKTRSAAALYIDRGRDGRDENKRIFAAIEARRAEIEAAFGGPLEWAPLEAKRASKIRWTQKAGYGLPEDSWPAAAFAQAEAMIRLDAALRPVLAVFAEGG